MYNARQIVLYTRLMCVKLLQFDTYFV